MSDSDSESEDEHDEIARWKIKYDHLKAKYKDLVRQNALLINKRELGE